MKVIVNNARLLVSLGSLAIGDAFIFKGQYFIVVMTPDSFRYMNLETNRVLAFSPQELVLRIKVEVHVVSS